MAKKRASIDKSPEGEKAAKINKFLKTVSDTNRLRILVVLGDGEMNVTDIHNKLKLPQNLTSHHISKLKSLELLNEKREGTFRHYSVNKKKLREYTSMFKEMMGI